MRRSIGHIEYKGNNRYRIKVSLGKDTTGKYRFRWFSGRGNKKDAENKLAEILTKLNNNGNLIPGKVTVSEYFTRWLADYAQPNLSPRSYERYAGIVSQYIIPAMGNIQLAKLKPDIIQKHYTDILNTGMNPRTVKYHHAILHIAFKTALKWGLMTVNVADSVQPPKIRRVDMNTWDESEINRFLEAAKHTQYYALFYTALFTGMRRSELLALRWQDIDFIYSQISVSRGIHQLKDNSFVYTEPKSEKSRRTIALPPSAFLVLEAYRKAREIEYTLMDTKLNDSELVFSTLGKPLRPNSITRAWHDMAVKAGVKPIRLHDARHTHASLMLKQGIHPKVVQERLGHSTIAMTLDIYSHVTPGLQEAAAKSFDTMITSKIKEGVSTL